MVMSGEQTTTYHIDKGVLTYTVWTDQGQTVISRGGFPLSAVTRWHGNDDAEYFDVYFGGDERLRLPFPSTRDAGQSYVDFDEHLSGALRGTLDEGERGIFGGEPL